MILELNRKIIQSDVSIEPGKTVFFDKRPFRLTRYFFMEKKLSRIISSSKAMAEYPEIMLTTFDQRLLPHLSLVVINDFPIGLDRLEIEKKRKLLRNSRKKFKK